MTANTVKAWAAEIRRQVRDAEPKDDTFPWRQAFLNLAEAMDPSDDNRVDEAQS